MVAVSLKKTLIVTPAAAAYQLSENFRRMMALAVAVRRWFPIPVLAVAAAAMGAYLLLGQFYGPILFSLALIQSQFETYSAPDGKFLGVEHGIGTPFLLYGP